VLYCHIHAMRQRDMKCAAMLTALPLCDEDEMRCVACYFTLYNG